MILYTAVFAQSPRQRFRDEINEAFSLVYDNPEESIRLGMSAYHIAKDAKDAWAMAIARGGMGYISYEVGDYEASYKNNMAALKALDNSDTTDLYNKTLILNHLAIIHADFNNHDEAIRYGKEALKVAKEYIKKHKEHARERGQLRLLIDIPYYMAIEYQAKGQHKTAGKILVDLWESAEESEDVLTYAQVLNELGAIKLRNAEYGEAQEYFGLVVSGKGVLDEDKCIAYHNLAATYLEQGNYEKAMGYYSISLDLGIRMDDPYSQFTSYLDMGELEFRANNKAKAIEYWETGLSIYDQVDSDPELYSIYNWLQLAYMDFDLAKAKEFNRKYSELNNFYVKQQTFQREEEAQSRQELINIIDEERQERVDAEQRNRFIQQFWPVFLGVALLVIFSIIMGIRYYKALRANRGLAQAQLNTQAAMTSTEE